MTHGGARRGAGRPKGAANKFSERARAKAAAEGITPLGFMLGVLRDEANELSVRMDAAKAAAPYMHARLESIKHSGDADNPVNVDATIESDRAFASFVAVLESIAQQKAGVSWLEQARSHQITHPTANNSDNGAFL
jgi:hypothetical protein